METKVALQYQLVEKVILLISEHQNKQLNIEVVAHILEIEPDYLQETFNQWAGVSFKRFLKFLSTQHAKSLLKKTETNLFNIITNYTNSYDNVKPNNLLINIENISPEEYIHKGENLTIYYHHYSSVFGTILIANTSKGIYHIAFTDDCDIKKNNNLKNQLPNAIYKNEKHSLQTQAVKLFQNPIKNHQPLKLHIKGTDFQLKVWKALLQIPLGKLTTYGNIAKQIDKPKASRAVGTAIGSNPIAFLIPCHRVIQSTGGFGNYMWGAHRKQAIIGWESAKTQN